MERLLKIGQVVCDTYVVEKLIGTGASAEVYRVKHRYFPGNQAMKVFKEIKISPDIANLPFDEAQMLREIECPNVIRVLDANIVETSRGLRFFFTMDYVSGGTVQDYWCAHNKHRMDVSNIVEILRQACRGIAAAHRANPPIVHRDIKPHNLLIEFGKTGLHVRVCDFDLADRADSPSIQTAIVGALIYKPPEGVRNSKGGEFPA